MTSPAHARCATACLSVRENRRASTGAVMMATLITQLRRAMQTGSGVHIRLADLRFVPHCHSEARKAEDTERLLRT
jgi:hypothetical protein